MLLVLLPLTGLLLTLLSGLRLRLRLLFLGGRARLGDPLTLGLLLKLCLGLGLGLLLGLILMLLLNAF